MKREKKFTSCVLVVSGCALAPFIFVKEIVLYVFGNIFIVRCGPFNNWQSSIKMKIMGREKGGEREEKEGGKERKRERREKRTRERERQMEKKKTTNQITSRLIQPRTINRFRNLVISNPHLSKQPIRINTRG